MRLKTPKRKLLGFSWVVWLNYWVLQWFFIRLWYIPYTKTLDGHTKWGLHKGVIPFSGFFGRRRYLSVLVT